MTVYIYMFGSLSPVIDFAELEINYQTSILSSLFIIISGSTINKIKDNCYYYYILLETLLRLLTVWVVILKEFNNIFMDLDLILFSVVEITKYGCVFIYIIINLMHNI